MSHRTLIAAAALALTAATAPQAQIINLTLGVTEMRQLAADSIAAGNVEQARTLAEGLLLLTFSARALPSKRTAA